MGCGVCACGECVCGELGMRVAVNIITLYLLHQHW